MPACVPPSRHRQSSDLQACTSNSCTTRPGKRAYTSIPYRRSRTRASSDVPRLQCYLRLDRGCKVSESGCTRSSRLWSQLGPGRVATVAIRVLYATRIRSTKSYKVFLLGSMFLQ